MIEVDLDNQPDDEDMDMDEMDEEDGPAEDDEAETSAPVKFRVSISKAGTSLCFECESDGEYVAINHISHEPAAKVTPFPGSFPALGF